MLNHKLIAVPIIIAVLILSFIFYNRNYHLNQLQGTLSFPTRTISVNKLFNLDFKYIINNNACSRQGNSSHLLAVFIITSYFGNVELRSAMRRAFPEELLEKFNLRRVFLLGLAPNDKYTSQKSILNENKHFGDLLQGNFIEAYRNLTYKHIMGIKWAALQCSKAQFIIKMDDDIIVNMYKIVELLKSLTIEKQYIAGYVSMNSKPKRDPVNKWFVTYQEFVEAKYPTFVSGWFYVTKPEVCQKLVDISTEFPYFWIDDVFVTGILAEQLNLEYYNLKKYFAVHSETLQCCIHDAQKYRYDCEFLIGPNGGDNNFFFEFNEALKQCFYGKCHKRWKPLNETCVAEKKIVLQRGNPSIKKYRLS